VAPVASKPSFVPAVKTALVAPVSEKPTFAGKPNRGTGGGRGRGGRQRSKETDPCHQCGQLGHWTNELCVALMRVTRHVSVLFSFIGLLATVFVVWIYISSTM